MNLRAMAAIEPDVCSKPFGALKTSGIPDNREQSEGIDHADPEQFHAAQHQRFSADSFANHDSELIAACALVREFGKIVRERLALQFCPVTFFKNPVLGLRLMKPSITQSNSKLIEVTLEGIARRNLIGYGFLMRVQQFSNEEKGFAIPFTSPANSCRADFF